jgi:riboflavin synthase
MFTGLIRSTGSVLERAGHDLKVRPADAGFLANAARGDSMAVNGVCLTLTTLAEGSFTVFMSDETLKLTNLPLLRPGAAVNLEKPLSLQDLLHGHLVQGHVDGLGIVEDLYRRGENWTLKVRHDPGMDRHMVLKGSIAVNGVSLTISGRTGSMFEVAVIPETVANTNLGGLRPGDKVNLETDLIAKYVDKLASPSAEGPPGRARDRGRP